MRKVTATVETGYVTLGKLRRKEDCYKGYCRCCGWKVERRRELKPKTGKGKS